MNFLQSGLMLVKDLKMSESGKNYDSSDLACVLWRELYKTKLILILSSFSHHITNVFVEFQSTEFSETPSPDSESVNSLEGHSEPSWFKDIKFDDSDTEQLADDNDYVTPSKYPKNVSIL